MRLCPQRHLAARAFRTPPTDEQIAYLASFVPLSIIAAPPVLYGPVFFTYVSACHFYIVLSGWWTKFSHDIYVIINLVKSAFYVDNCFTSNSHLARVFIIPEDNQQHHAVYARLLAKQNGCCSYCSKLISESDTIVSKAYSRRSKYFHQVCATRIKII